jgi:hypothetical protein
MLVPDSARAMIQNSNKTFDNVRRPSNNNPSVIFNKIFINFVLYRKLIIMNSATDN